VRRGGSVGFVVTEHPSHLDARRVRRYEEIRGVLEAIAEQPVSSTHYLDVERLGPGPVVLSGSRAPWAAHDPTSLDRLGEVVCAADAPVLGICAGLQLLSRFAGGRIEHMEARGQPPERGYLPLEVLDDRDLLAGLAPQATLFQDHMDEVFDVPPDFRLLARTEACEIQAFAAPERRWWGTQFHPEQFDADHLDGRRVLENFFRLASDR
jgi:GMP synthase (glutamine-hydrolysing)